MNKVVNIYPSMAILGTNPPIRTTQIKVTKSTSEIRTCIIARAIVDEVLPNGKLIRLNLNNYNEDYVGAYKAKMEASAKKEKEKELKHAVVEDAKPMVEIVNITEAAPKVEEKKPEQYQLGKRKKNKKNRQPNRDTDEITYSTNTPEESIAGAEVSADVIDTESTETVDVEDLS